MPLVRIPEPFDHPDWLFELKHDGFRAMAIIEAGRCSLVSRNGHVFARWPELRADITGAVRATSAVLDGEVTCLQPDGRSDFYALMLRRQAPVFYAFDVLSLERVQLLAWILGRQRLKVCPEPKCGELFWKVRRQLYCSRTCVNRENMRAHLKRQAERASRMKAHGKGQARQKPTKGGKA